MTLRDRAVLEVEAFGTVGEFHLMHAEVTTELNRDFLMGGVGQRISEAFEILSGTDDVDGRGQSGAYLDVGQGTDTITVSWTGGREREEYGGVDIQWGDGSTGGPDEDDATGAHPDTQIQVLRWWVRNARTDSFRNQARLHWAEWTDGSYSDSAGIFGEPITVVISNLRTERNDNTPSSFDGTLELLRASSLEEFTDENDAGSALPEF